MQPFDTTTCFVVVESCNYTINYRDRDNTFYEVLRVFSDLDDAKKYAKSHIKNYDCRLKDIICTEDIKYDKHDYGDYDDDDYIVSYKGKIMNEKWHDVEAIVCVSVKIAELSLRAPATMG